MNNYDTGELVTIVALFALAAYLLGRIHAENAARRYHEKRDAARRRYNHPTNNTRKGNHNQ